MSSKLVERRLNDFQRRYGDTALELACYAALPVALNPELLHFLRINFFFDPPKQLPYTVEFEFLTSGLCRAIDVELYEIEPETRNELLKRLMERNVAPQRIRDVATLLLQYVEHHSPWKDRVELERAQQLTALNFLDPVKAKQWLDEAEANPSQVGRAEQEWFIAMRQQIDQLPSMSPDIRAGLSLSSQQLEQLQEALIEAFPTTVSLARMLDDELDKNLREIAGEGSLREIVFTLIKTAQAQGWVEDLVGVAYQTNAQQQFDVFLAHDSADTPQVRTIAFKLKQRGLKPWLDEEQIRPGRSFQDEIQQAIPLVKSAAIFVGLQGLGNWQSWQLRALISLCVKKEIPIIPILLPGVSSLPEHLLFLKQFRWVEFAQGIDDASALDLLEWGITGRKPKTTVEYKNKPGRVSVEQQVEKVETISQPSDDLSSDLNVDYTRLRNLLKTGNWKDADYETYKVMLQVVGRKERDWIRDHELLSFPCTDLRTIDQLWVKYSNGRFGFSVQKKIYLSVGGIADGKYYEEAWNKLGDRVGWRVNKRWIYYDFVFDTPAPVGHLPFVGRRAGGSGVWGARVAASVFFSRIETCK